MTLDQQLDQAIGRLDEERRSRCAPPGTIEYWQSEVMRLRGAIDEQVAQCPACGDPIDYCQGHGDIGDPVGAGVLMDHDNGDHSGCVIDCEGSDGA